MMKKLYTGICCLLLLLCLPDFLAACSCAGQPTFCQSVVNNNGEVVATLIIFGEKIRNKSDGMDVKLLSTIHGETSTNEIFIKSGNGADCGLWTDQFEVGEQFILSLYPTNNDNPTSAYMISSCGTHWLKVENGKVKGKITPSLTEVAISDFPSISNCGDFSPVPSQNALINVFPNPATTAFQVDIELDNSIQGFFNIYDMAGRFIEKVAIEGTNQVSIPYEVEKLSAGIYLVEVYLWSRRELFKIVVGR